MAVQFHLKQFDGPLDLLLTLIGNFLTLAAPEWVGNVLYAVLVMVSSPMVCGQIWIISLLLWAALMWTCILLLGKRRD